MKRSESIWKMQKKEEEKGRIVPFVMGNNPHLSLTEPSSPFIPASIFVSNPVSANMPEQEILPKPLTSLSRTY